MARRAPHVSLRPYVLEYVGWFEHMAQPLCRREVPSEVVPVIVSFGAPVRIFDHDDQRRWTDFTSFTTGAFDTYVLVGSAGPSGGLQINLSILGARLFLSRPLGELTNRVVALEDLFGRSADRLAARLFDAGTWDQRFDLADCELRSRILASRLPHPSIVWTWRRLVESQGRASVGRIVEEVGWSQKHLIAQFREHIGLAPKSLARVLRFGRAVECIKSTAPGGQLKLTDLALDCGYYDQAHFTRDFRAFAGVTPTELIASAMPDSAGFSADR
jgi:AraC-like DNA-binding protein